MIPGLSRTGEQRTVQACMRLTATEVAVMERIAVEENLLNRDGTPNRSAIMQLALALYLRGHRDGPYKGWRPENGAIIPDPNPEDSNQQ